MNERDLYRAIGRIDDELIEQAASAGKKKTARPWIKWTGLAACFAIVVAAGLMLPKLQTTEKSADTVVPESAPTAEMAAASSGGDIDAVSINDMGFDVSTLSVTATDYRGSSISTDTDFIIAANGITEDMVREYVNITPETDYTLTTASDGSVILDPHSLGDNAIVNLNLTDDEGKTLKRWAFQTADVFSVTSHYPGEGDSVYNDSVIEFTFSSAEVDITSIESAFSIEPQVSGSFEHRGRTVLFVPDEPLTPNVDYTVTLDGTACDTNGTAIGETVSFTFLALNAEIDRMFSRSSAEPVAVRPDEIPVLTSPASFDYRDLPIRVEVYAYRSFDDFAVDISEAFDRSSYEPAVDEMTLITEFEALQQRKNEISTARYIVFPDELEEGAYAVRYTLETDDGTVAGCYGYIQSSALAVYAAATTDQMLVWINDTDTDSPVSDAEVRIGADGAAISAVTDDQGVAVADLPETKDGQAQLVTVESDGRRFAAMCRTGYSNGDTYSEDYFGYVYTSREMYLPTDTVRVWGYVTPRRDVDLPQTVDIVLGRSEDDIYSYGGIYMTQQAEVKADGSFSCEFELVDQANAYAPLAVYINYTKVCDKYIEIADFEKPVYIIEAKTAKEVYFAHEVNEVFVSASVSFYDGTPASNMKLETRGDWDQDSEIVVCDDNGAADIVVSYGREATHSWQPYSPSITLSSAELDSVSTYEYLHPLLLCHDVMLQAEVDDGAIAITANHIEPGKITTRDELYDGFPENIRGEAFTGTVTITGTERYWQSTKTGSYVDLIYKKTVDTYSHELIELPIGPFEVEVVNGKANFDGIAFDDDRSYTINVSAVDSYGITVSTDIYYSGSLYGMHEDEEELNLRFNVDNGQDGNVWYMPHFAEDQDLEIELYNGASAFEPDDNGYFISFLQQENLYDVQLREGRSFTLEYSEDNLPNVNIAGAYYCDGLLYGITKLQTVFAPEERELQVDITPEHSTLRPGQETEVTVTVTDKDGDPVADAAVLVSVTDEAAFAVAPQEAAFLDNLYQVRYWGFISSYISSSGEMLDMMAEMGGGNGVSFRKDFSNDLNFDCLTTDANGKAVTTVKLADNLTSWRITALAAQGKNAGDGKVNITSTLPLFLNPVFTDTFLYGDDVSFGCRTYGDLVGSGDEVTYEAAVIDQQGNEVDIITLTCPAGQNAAFNFGKLDKGSYTLRLSGSAGDHSDAVELTFEVVSTAAEVWVTKEVTADEVNSLEPAKYPVTVTVSNAAYKTYNRVLNTVNYSGSVRTDEISARNLAGEILAEISDDETDRRELPSLTSLKENYGFVGELSAAGVGGEYYTARLAAAVPDYLNKPILTELFYDILDNPDKSTEALTSAYLGLAAFGQPVLGELRSFAAENEALLSHTDMLRLAYALALLGDFDSAYDIYSRYVTPKLEILELSADSRFLRCDLGGVEEANVEYTALALAIASVMELQEAEQLAEYVMYAKQTLSHTENTEFYPLCELMAFLRYYTPAAGESEQVSFTYVKNGKTVTQTVPRRGMAVISFGSEQELKNADFDVTSGEASVVAAYVADIQQVSEQKSPSITVEKTMPSTAEPGEDITVTVTVTVSEPCVVYVQDHIPSGFRMADTAAYVDGQTVRFYEFIDVKSKTITYRIKPVVSGSFVVEMPVAADVESNTLVTGQRSMVEVVK